MGNPAEQHAPEALKTEITLTAPTETEIALAQSDPPSDTIEAIESPAASFLAPAGSPQDLGARFPIEQITPSIEGGRFPAKAVVGELVPVSAVAYREGHSMMGCNVVLEGPDGRRGPFTRMSPGAPGTDRWFAHVRPDAVGAWTFTVEAFSDPYLTWHDTVSKKIAAGQGLEDLANDLAEGAALLNEAATGVPGGERRRVTGAAQALADSKIPLFSRGSPALALTDVLWRHPLCQQVTRAEPLPIWCDRERALFSAWYEFFPRSEGAVVDEQGRPVKHGTFKTATPRLQQVADMGFDVVYLPPIHPIGRVNRKGPNNTLVAGPDDIG